MPATTAVDDVYAYLTTQALIGGASGWSGFARRLMDTPDKVVVIQEDGGGLSEQSAASGIGDSALKDPGVLVTVRAAAWDGNASFAKAQAIRLALHGLRGTSLSAGGDVYFGISALTPEPIFAGYDGNGRPLHTISFRLLRSA